MKLVMTLLVRDAEELLPLNLEFHLRKGVDFFVITDNRSTDGTARIIERYARAGLAEMIFEPSEQFEQAAWVTRMARRAAELGADWVINNDEDEFWASRGGNLKSVLAATPPEWDALSVVRRNHPPVSDPGDRHVLASMIYREQRSLNALGEPLLPKICHRAFADIDVGFGNHSVSRDGRQLAARPSDTLAISHFPVRGYDLFERKLVQGAEALARTATVSPKVGETWRRLHAEHLAGRLRDWFDDQVLTPEKISRQVAGGELVLDDEIARALGLAAGGS